MVKTWIKAIFGPQISTGKAGLTLLTDFQGSSKQDRDTQAPSVGLCCGRQRGKGHSAVPFAAARTAHRCLLRRPPAEWGCPCVTDY